MRKWDIRFLELAALIAGWSKDPSTKCGAVIVRPDRTVASVGFNGFPRNLCDDPASYADRTAKYSKIVHCEMNAMIHAGQSVKGCTLYTWPFLSCDRCTVHMLQAGITRFVAPYRKSADASDRWSSSLNLSRMYIIAAGASFDEYSDFLAT